MGGPDGMSRERAEGSASASLPGTVLYEFARFVTDSWDAECPVRTFKADPESSLVAIAADIAEQIAASRYADAWRIAEQTQGAERLAAALARAASDPGRTDAMEREQATEGDQWAEA